MGGVCGIVSADWEYPISESSHLAMLNSLNHRGPDDAGTYCALGVALGAQRLAILGRSEREHMPMATEDGRYWIAYDGEVYNYTDLRSLLKGRGYSFGSNTDTEVVLKIFVAEGPAALERLNGMFAFAIWDSHERALLLARDRLGIKPLYYSIQGDRLYFASEEKALFAAGVAPEFDAETWEELLCFRHTAGERTPYVGIKRLLPGHFLLWQDGHIRTKRWWNLAERVRHLRAQAPRNPVQWFGQTFDSAVDMRRSSDVPVGVLLSGGIDSSSVAASLSSHAGSGVASFTVRFDESDYDEGPLALAMAERWKLDFHELKVAPNELLTRLHGASWLNDEPLADGCDLHLWTISRYAKTRVTVLHSGEGSDETLGGASRYQPLLYPRLLNSMRPVFPRVISALNINGRLRKLSRFLALGSETRFILYNACNVLPQDLTELGMKPIGHFPFREERLAEARALYPGEPVRQAMYSDQHTFLCSLLDRNDRMTMGASVQCRMPFLDNRLVEGLAALPSSVLLNDRQGNSLLRESVGARLPKAVLRHRTLGSGAPWQRYLRKLPELRELVGELPDLEPINSGPFDRRRLKHVIDRFLKGDNYNASLVTQLMMLVIWRRACFNRAVLGTSFQHPAYLMR